MDIGYVKRLIKLLSESEVDEIEIEEEGKKVRLVKHRNSRAEGMVPPPPPVRSLPEAPSPVVAAAEPSAAVPVPTLAAGHHEIKSPIVGTFYRSPAPEAPPFVQVGTMIEPGAVLCIVEAMKLMNEIESDVSGKIVKILVENGQPIEYDQTLFLVETA